MLISPDEENTNEEPLAGETYEIFTKKHLTSLVLILLLLCIMMMLTTKGMLFHTMSGPDAPRIPHYYNYLHPTVYLAGGMYTAPVAAVLSILSAIFTAVTLLRKNQGKASFFMVLCSFLMTAIVFFLSAFTLINLVIFLLLLAACAAAYWGAYKAQGK